EDGVHLPQGGGVPLDEGQAALVGLFLLKDRAGPAAEGDVGVVGVPRPLADADPALGGEGAGGGGRLRFFFVARPGTPLSGPGGLPRTRKPGGGRVPPASPGPLRSGAACGAGAGLRRACPTGDPPRRRGRRTRCAAPRPVRGGGWRGASRRGR